MRLRQGCGHLIEEDPGHGWYFSIQTFWVRVKLGFMSYKCGLIVHCGMVKASIGFDASIDVWP